MSKLFKSLSSAILSLYAVSACKSDEVNPDIFYGQYKTQIELSYGRGNQITTQTGSGTLTVSKVDDSKILIVESYQSVGREYKATINGRKFTVDKTTESIVVDGKTQTGVLNGSGEFSKDGKTITLNTSTDVATSSPFNRSIKVNGSK